MSEHGHGAQKRADVEDADRDVFSAAYWDARYGSASSIWSGQPNQRLVEHAAHLPAGHALDVGTGEGADAVWLASRGWRVTAVDVSQIALDRGAAHAETAGVGHLVQWRQVDLREWVAPVAGFDLVSAQFMHITDPPRSAIYRGLAAAVAPGGTLLVVAHHPSDMDTGLRRPPMEGLFFLAEDLAADLDPTQWASIDTSEPSREVPGPDGERIVIRDTILRATRGA